MASKPSSSSNEFEGFRDLGNHIHLYKPTTSTSKTTPEPPSTTPNPTLIILCAWMGGATPRRISKYLSAHQTLFPRSAILLIRALVAETMYRSPSAVQARLRPARDAVVQVLTEKGEGEAPSLLIHAMSNGGANTAVQLLRLLRDSNPQLAVPLKGLILDCAPTDTSVESLLAVSRGSIPPSSLRPVLLAALYPVIYSLPMLGALGLRNPVEELRKELNDVSLVPRECRRLYMCGGRDEVVGVESVRTHSAEADDVGFQVDRVLFERAEHCALVMRDGEKYRRVVREWWDGRSVGDGDWVGDGKVGRDKRKGRVKAKL